MNKVLTTAAAICLIAVSFGLTSCKKENNMNNIKQDDPEFAALWDNFMQRDVLAHGNLDAKKRYLIVMAAHIATQSVNGYKVVLNEALDNGISPVEAKEVVYQAVPYVGMAKVYDFFTAANDVMRQRGITLPLAGQSTTTPDNRFDKGLAQQVGIFGDRILQAHATAPQNQKHIQNFLSANCFGDYYTRKGLDYFRAEVKKAGFPGLHIQLMTGGEPNDNFLNQIKVLGISSLTLYNWGGPHPEDYIQWGTEAFERLEKWSEAVSIPYFPNASIGWDDTPRFPHKTQKDVVHFNQSPRSFAAFLQKAKEYCDNHPEQPKLITIYAWNEWVEGAYLLPDLKYGFDYVQAVKEVIVDKKYEAYKKK